MSDVDQNETKQIIFSEGIPGFEKDNKFIIVQVEDKGPFYYMQSLDSDLCLLIADPFVFFPDYQIDLPDEVAEDLGQDEAHEKLVVYVVLTIHEEFKLSTANLKAPVIVNAVTLKGIQYIQQQSQYNTKHLLFPKIEKPVEEEAL